ncbi:endolytic transglycosylase MltG [Sungkyunkwania multivorans]|uniref:Endolytic murein transglycosylase n=1 Tax=Sungkyunkwania multivorans TaxID=1173618 RepID=A0ABW3CXP9_9FLAO
MYIKRILTIIVLAGCLAGGWFVYHFYDVFFSPNTAFNNEKANIYIPTGAGIGDVREILAPLLKNADDFVTTAEKKGYASNVKAGHYIIKKGMTNNDIVNTLRVNNVPIRISFNNQERLNGLAGRIAQQIEADSVSLMRAFSDSTFLKKNGFTKDNALAMYLPNSYEVFWNISAEGFRDRMLEEYQRFWNDSRKAKASSYGLTEEEIISLAAVVQKETVKADERPRVAGVYLNRIKKGIRLQADPTVIYALKKHTGNFDTVVKRVLYKDLELDSPYNTYKYAGVPPGPITMPDISAIEAVLDAEKHDYLYFVADVTNFGYHKFAKTLAQHNRNRIEYKRWIDKQRIFR